MTDLDKLAKSLTKAMMERIEARWTINPTAQFDGVAGSAPDWAKHIGFALYREQGWNAFSGDTQVASGEWGDELFLLTDGRFGSTKYPQGWSVEAAIARGLAIRNHLKDRTMDRAEEVWRGALAAYDSDWRIDQAATAVIRTAMEAYAAEKVAEERAAIAAWLRAQKKDIQGVSRAEAYFFERLAQAVAAGDYLEKNDG